VVNYADGVTISQNTIQNDYGNGILLATGVTGLSIQDNHIINTRTNLATGLRAGIRELWGGPASGMIAPTPSTEPR
jgi:hypothetical protein